MTATEPTRDCPACEAGIAHDEHCPTPETHNWGCGCPTGIDGPALAHLRARLVADRDRAARNANLARHEQTRLVADGTVAGLDTALRLLDTALAAVSQPETCDRSTHRPQAGDPSPAGRSAADPSGGGAA